LLKGEFQGMDQITVAVKEIGGKKQLTFHGGHVGQHDEAQAVGAAPSDGTPAA